MYDLQLIAWFKLLFIRNGHLTDDVKMMSRVESSASEVKAVSGCLTAFSPLADSTQVKCFRQEDHLCQYL